MRTPAEKAALLRAYNNSLLDEDPELADAEGAFNEGLEVKLPPERELEQGGIAMARRRPVLAIRNGETVLEFRDQEDVPLWKSRLEQAREVLGPAIAAVGGIELAGNPDYSWGGPGG